ncbi:hypothetical protein GCM10009789_20540 [Kribbella sancticallisti]|uniref:Uncharacterized protein n=1 Tax=Kribbella sancticallisti TaxID=460087 RepID=A0ABN2D113_9ACTN
MTLLTAARIIAAGLSLTTFVFLFLHDSFRSGNLFLVPDLVLCAALLIAAALPRQFAVPALIGAFGMAAGVFATSVSSYAVDGEFGLPSTLGVATSAAMAALLGRTLSTAGKLSQG